MNRLLIYSALLLTTLLASSCGNSDTETEPDVDKHPILKRTENIYTDDLDSIIQRRVIRVLISYSKTNFFFDGGGYARV